MSGGATESLRGSGEFITIKIWLLVSPMGWRVANHFRVEVAGYVPEYQNAVQLRSSGDGG